MVADEVGSLDMIRCSVLSPYDLPLEWRIEFEERAAILEYDGGLSRTNADQQALNEIRERMKYLNF